MPGSLDTTNTMLAIIAAVMVLQGLVLLGLAFAGWKIYRAATETLRELDDTRVKPLAAKVDGILDQVHRLTDRVQQRAERIEAAFDNTVGRVSDTVSRVSDTTSGVTSTVGDSVHRVSDAVTSIRSLIVNALTTEGTGYRQAAPRAVPPAGRDHIHHDETREIREGGF